MENDARRGGYRENAGRKEGRTQTPVSVRLDNDLLQYLNDHAENKNAYINNSVRKAKEAKEATESKQPQGNEIICPYCHNIISIKPGKTK